MLPHAPWPVTALYVFDAFGMFRRAPAPLALARGFALYDADTSTHALHMHRCIQTNPHKTMRCELQSVVPDARALLLLVFSSPERITLCLGRAR